MEIRTLRYFLTVVQEESITRAANALHITQPTLSRQLASWFGQWFDDLNVLFTSNLPAASSVMASRQLAYSINIRGSLSFYDERKVVCRPLRPRLTATSTSFDN